MDLIAYTLILYGLTLFVLKTYRITGLMDWAIMKAPNSYYEKLFSCYFCLSFRIGVLLTVIAYFKLTDLFGYEIFIAPFLVSGYLRIE